MINGYNIMGFKNSLEWQIGSVKSEAIAFLTHGCFLTGQRERYLVVYPFANIILNGQLSNNPSFSNFRKGEVFIFCNFRPYKACRPDLLAFSSKGDVFLIEGKQRANKNQSSALGILKEGVGELERYSRFLREFSNESNNDPYKYWSDVYYNCYVKNPKHGFPKLDAFVRNSISMQGMDEIKSLFRKINSNLGQGNILYGLAFNDHEDQESFFPLDSFDLMSEVKYKSIPPKGIKKYGYNSIDAAKIYRIIDNIWNERLGQLFLFGIDKQLDTFRILERIG